GRGDDPDGDGRGGVPEPARQRPSIGVGHQHQRSLRKARRGGQGVAVDPGMAAANRPREPLPQDDPREGSPRGCLPHFAGGRSATGTATATGRARLETVLAAASTRAPLGKTTSILPAPGEPATTPTPNCGWVI